MICGHSSQNYALPSYFNGLSQALGVLRQFGALALWMAWQEAARAWKSSENAASLTIPPAHALFRALIRFVRPDFARDYARL
jgi:hypothetical protein